MYDHDDLVFILVYGQYEYWGHLFRIKYVLLVEAQHRRLHGVI